MPSALGPLTSSFLLLIAAKGLGVLFLPRRGEFRPELGLAGGNQRRHGGGMSAAYRGVDAMDQGYRVGFVEPPRCGCSKSRFQGERMMREPKPQKSKRNAL